MRGSSDTSLEKDPFSRSPDEFIPSMAIHRYLENKEKILLVGDAAGRDYRALTHFGKEVFVLDIVPQPDIPRYYRQSIGERTPFEDKFFDGVVLAEVIEHLFEDHVALHEIQRILKDDGVLVLTVPYISNRQDEPAYHVRVHTPKTIRRLLEYCGFRVEEHFYRGMICRLPRMNFVTRLVSLGPGLLLHAVLGDKGLSFYRKYCFGLERWIGSTPFISTLQRPFTTYGGIMKARKSEKVDYAKIQIDEFSGKWVP